jgi:hypothetical protein
MSTINIDLATAKSIASLINIASKDKSGVPVLEQVRCTLFSDGMLVAVATDRYAIVTASYELDYSGETITFGIAHGVANFISRIKTPKGSNIPGTIEFNDDGYSMQFNGQAIIARHVTGNYPPVSEMVAKWQRGTEATPVELSLTLLSRLTKVVDRLGKRLEDWKVELGNSDNPSKPAPIRLTHGTFAAIQQPRISR